MTPDVHESICHPSLEHLFAHRSEAQEQAKAALEVSASWMKWYFDEKKGEVPFKVGDLVLLKGKDLRVKVKSVKLGTQNFGPYKVLQKLGPVTFRLELPKQMKVHPVFHASKLIMYHQDTVANRKPPQPPAIKIEGEPEFKVKEILDSKVVRGRVQYLVKWKGYDHSDDTWEPQTNLTNANELLQEFHQQHPDAPKAPIRVVTYGGKRFELSSYELAPKSTHRISLTDQDDDDYFVYHRMTESAKAPTRGSENVAGWDIYAAETHTIPPHSRTVVGTGIAIEPPIGTYTRIAPRSGLSARWSIDIGAGVVDSDYTGELKVIMINHSDYSFNVQVGERIAQIIFEAYVEGIPVDNKGPLRNRHARGDKGFGFTGR